MDQPFIFQLLEIYLPSKASITDLGSTPTFFSTGNGDKVAGGVKLTTHLYLVSKINPLKTKHICFI
jgi:hypothetical protein